MTRKLATISAGLVLVLQLNACGGGGTTGPTPVTTTTLAPCTQSLVFQDSGPVDPSTLLSLDITVSTMGRLDVILDWTFTSSSMGVYVVQGACTLAQFNGRNCSFLIRSEPGGAKPRKVSVSGVNPGAYQLLIANFGTVKESASTQVFLSSASCPALSGVVTGSGASHGGIDARIEAIVRR